MKKQGKKICVYINKDAMDAYDYLAKIAEKEDQSMSEIICGAIRQYAILKRQDVCTISDGACHAIVNDDPGKLQRTRMPGDKYVITCTEEYYLKYKNEIRKDCEQTTDPTDE